MFLSRTEVKILFPLNLRTLTTVYVQDIATGLNPNTVQKKRKKKKKHSSAPQAAVLVLSLSCSSEGEFKVPYYHERDSTQVQPSPQLESPF